MKRPFRSLFIGCGAAGGDWLRQFLTEPDVQLAAVVEPSDAAVARLKLPAGTPVFKELDPALDQIEADAAFIASPNVCHAPQFLACVRHGLHVFLEKPVALTVAEALAMQAAAEQARVKVFTPWAAERHFFLRELSERYRSGQLGRLIQIHGVAVGGNGFFSDVGEKAHYATRLPQISGGLIAHHTSHLIDWAMQIGGAVESVYGQTATTFPAPKSRQEEAATAILRFREGGAATLLESMLWHRDMHWDVIGDRAGEFIEWNPEARGAETYLTVARAVGEKTDRQVMTFDAFNARVNSAPSLVRRFLEMVRNDRPSPSALERAIAVMQVCDALHESARTGQVVQL